MSNQSSRHVLSNPVINLSRSEAVKPVEYTRVVHGSILCDPIQPTPSADWPNPTQPNTTNKFNCLVQPNLT